MIFSAAILSFSPSCAVAQGRGPSLYQSWEWQCSTGGFGGRDSLTPEKAGYTRKIEFTKKGKYREFRSDTLRVSTRFMVRREKTIFSEDSLHIIRFADSARFPPLVIWKLTQDTLELGDNHVEPFGHRYRRTGK